MKKLSVILLFLCSILFNLHAQMNTDRLMSIGKNALYFEDYVLSIQYFNQVIKVKPYLLEPYFYRAVAKIQLEDYYGAESDLNNVLQKNPFIPMAYYARGFCNKNIGKLQEANMDFDNALLFSPNNQLYIINKVEVLEQMKQYDSALVWINFLIDISPKSIPLKFEKGKVLLMNSDTIAAYNVFSDIAKTDSLNADAWNAKALVNLLMDNEDNALEDYNKAVNLGTKNPGTFANRGIINYRNKNYRQALADFDTAVQLDSLDDNILFNRSLLRIEVGDYNNALADLNKVVSLNSESSEAIYQRGLINGILGNYNDAINDFSLIIDKHPSFIPALYNRADIYAKQGDEKKAFIDRYNASEIEKKHKQGKDEINTNVKVNDDVNIYDAIASIASLFISESASDQNKGIRGLVQNNNFTVDKIDNFVVSYYQYKENNGIEPKLYNPLVIQNFNDSKLSPAKLYLVCKEVKLTEAMIALHFNSIDLLSSKIENNQTDAINYFLRALDYSLVQDFENAINDYTKAIILNSSMVLAYFNRANIRFKMLEKDNNEKWKNEMENSFNNSLTKNKDKIIDVDLIKSSYNSSEFEMILRDYEKVISLAPDFAIAWYNKANIYVYQKDYISAISAYTSAIKIDNDFGEAYYNRGLIYLITGKVKNAVSDLSKAGELGVYQSYSILKKINSLIK